MLKTKINNSLKDTIADNLYIPLAMKCRETQRKDTFFSDPFSCEIMEMIDYDFSKYKNAIRSSVGVALRANYFDEIVKAFIHSNHNPVIVHIGCGLDTRFLRTGAYLCNEMFFYELDLPEVMEMRRRLLAESKNNRYISASMLETGWMDILAERHHDAKFMFVAEGVFRYFETQQVKSVVQNIAQRFHNSKIVFDAVNSWMCRYSHLLDSLKLTRAIFKFACDDPAMIESWSDKIRLESEKLFPEFKEWKKAGFINNIAMRVIPAIRYSSRLLTYNII